MQPSVVDLTRELVSTASVNPRLAPAGDPFAGEAQMTAWLTSFCEKAGWRWAIQRVHPGRENFIALVPGGGAQTLLWEAHQDTVGVEGMSVPPFGGELREGRIYGRGASDVKGPMAAMLVALQRAALEPAEHRPTILFAATVNEECGFTGVRALADIWRPASVPGRPLAGLDIVGGNLTGDELRLLRPAAALVAEPTVLDVVVAHRGVVRWRSTVHGRAAHSSRPELGLNALYAMASVVRLIEEYDTDELAARAVDPLCGRSTACVTTIIGGVGPNTVPDRAVIDVDCRLTPSEFPDDAYGALCDHLAAKSQLRGCRLEHEPPWMQSRGLSSQENRAWAEYVAAIVRSEGATGTLRGVPYGTNAASIAAAGIPTVVFGPGSIDQAHTADEWIAVDQLELAVEALYRLAVAGFG